MKTNSRVKGAAGEREVAKMFSRWFPGCRRSVGQARIGYEQPDIIGGGIESEFFVEVKFWSIKSYRPGRAKKHWYKLIEDMVKHQKIVGDEAPSALAEPILVHRFTGSKAGWRVACLRLNFPALWSSEIGQQIDVDSVMVVSWEDFAEHLDTVYDNRGGQSNGLDSW